MPWAVWPEGPIRAGAPTDGGARRPGAAWTTASAWHPRAASPAALRGPCRPNGPAGLAPEGKGVARPATTPAIERGQEAVAEPLTGRGHARGTANRLDVGVAAPHSCGSELPEGER